MFGPSLTLIALIVATATLRLVLFRPAQTTYALVWQHVGVFVVLAVIMAAADTALSFDTGFRASSPSIEWVRP